LLLRVERPGGGHDEIYLARGLTIGRTEANTIVLPDDDSVDRTHAFLEVDADGRAWLRCIEPDSSLDAGGTAVPELALEAGTRFQVGRTRFQCIAGQGGVDRPEPSAPASCPLCGSARVRPDEEGIRDCPDCNEPILAIRLEPHGAVLLLPAVYGSHGAQRYVTRGGMGLVLKGAHELGRKPVAIKVLLPGELAARCDSDRFEREAAMMARVEHPTVVKLLDHGRAGRFHYLVLEWIDGPTSPGNRRLEPIRQAAEL
jgi:hypothetical protein